MIIAGRHTHTSTLVHTWQPQGLAVESVPLLFLDPPVLPRGLLHNTTLTKVRRTPIMALTAMYRMRTKPHPHLS